MEIVESSAFTACLSRLISSAMASCARTWAFTVGSSPSMSSFTSSRKGFGCGPKPPRNPWAMFLNLLIVAIVSEQERDSRSLGTASPLGTEANAQSQTKKKNQLSTAGGTSAAERSLMVGLIHTWCRNEKVCGSILWRGAGHLLAKVYLFRVDIPLDRSQKLFRVERFLNSSIFQELSMLRERRTSVCPTDTLDSKYGRTSTSSER